LGGCTTPTVTPTATGATVPPGPSATPTTPARPATPAATTPSAAGCPETSPDFATFLEIVGRGIDEPCHQDVDLTFDAYWNAPGTVDCTDRIEPAWLACPSDASVEAPVEGATAPTGLRAFIVVAVDPESGIAVDRSFGTNVRLTGHFGDPAATTCRNLTVPSSPDDAVRQCRNAFVVTRLVPASP
jgi:hypothetical protein